MPILPINETTLAAPLIGTFDSQRLAELQQQVLVAIKRSRARTLVLDITGILRVAQAARLLGARVVLAGGFRPEVAQAIVSLGVDLAGLQTAATFQDGIALAAKSAGDRTTKDEPFDTAAPLSGIEGQRRRRRTKDEDRQP